MPRDSNGIYTLPTGNPVVTGTVITSTWANNTCGDIGNELTDSLSRSGEGGMLAPLRLVGGSIAAPSLTWGSFPQTGFYQYSPGNIKFTSWGGDIFGLADFQAYMQIPGVGGANARVIVESAYVNLLVSDATNFTNVTLGPTQVLMQAGINPTDDARVILAPTTWTATYNTDTRFLLDLTDTLYIYNGVTGSGLERVLTTSDIGGDNIFPGPNPTLADAIAAIRIGATDPVTDPHIAMGPTLIQAKGDATTVADLNIQSLGGDTTLYNGALAFLRLDTAGVLKLLGTDNAANQLDKIVFTQADGTERAAVGFDTSDVFALLAPVMMHLQNGTNLLARIGDYNTNATYLEVNTAIGGEQIMLYHLGDKVAATAPPGSGGLIVDGLYGPERVLTLGDLGVTTKYLTAQVTVTNTTTPANVPDLTFTLAAASTYKLSGFFTLYWAGTGPIYIEVAEGALADDMVGLFIPPPVVGGVYTYSFSGGLIGSRINLTVTSSLLGFQLIFEGTLTTSAASSVTVNICTPTASLDPFSIREGSRLTCELIS